MVITYKKSREKSVNEEIKISRRIKNLSTEDEEIVIIDDQGLDAAKLTQIDTIMARRGFTKETKG